MKRIIFFTISICILVFLSCWLYKDNFFNEILVETQNISDKKHNYYEINQRKYKKNISKFKIDSITYKISNSCFNSSNSKKDDKNLNKLSLNKCRIIDQNNKEIKIKDDYKNIVKLLLKLERKIVDGKIFKIQQDYYVSVGFDSNFHTPYNLYKYNYKKNRLDLLYTFDNEKVLGIKYKE